MIKTTNPRISAYDRGVEAANATESMDWNEETGEYNPFKPGSKQFNEYNLGLEETTDKIAELYGDI